MNLNWIQYFNKNIIKIFLLFSILLLLFFAIKSNNYQNIITECLECPQNQILNNIYSLVLEDSLNIPTENNAPKQFTSFCLKNNRFLYGGGINDNKIYVYDLSICKLIKKINVNFKKVSSIYGINVLNKDSIFIVKDYPPQIILIDSNGKIIKIRKDLDKIKNINLESRYRKIGFSFPVFLFYQNPIFDKNNNLHISIDFASWLSPLLIGQF